MPFLAFGLRTTPTVLFAVAAEHLPKNPDAKRADGRAHLRVYAEHVLQRADEPCGGALCEINPPRELRQTGRFFSQSVEDGERP